ncbi:hypothetical protein FQZ97_982950 [compost metagenome]
MRRTFSRSRLSPSIGYLRASTSKKSSVTIRVTPTRYPSPADARRVAAASSPAEALRANLFDFTLHTRSPCFTFTSNSASASWRYFFEVWLALPR